MQRTFQQVYGWRAKFLGYLFEKWVIGSLESQYGFALDETAHSYDQGIDFVGHFAEGIPVIGQSKHVETRLPIRHLRELEGVLSHDRASLGSIGVMATRTPPSPQSMWHFHRSPLPLIFFVSQGPTKQSSTEKLEAKDEDAEISECDDVPTRPPRNHGLVGTRRRVLPSASYTFTRKPEVAIWEHEYRNEDPKEAASLVWESLEAKARDTSHRDLDDEDVLSTLFPRGWAVTLNHATRRKIPTLQAVKTRGNGGSVLSSLQYITPKLHLRAGSHA